MEERNYIMKIIQTTNVDPDDYGTSLTIDLYDNYGNKVKTLSFHEGEPEDATLGRNFNDCFDIVKFVEEAIRLTSGDSQFTIEYVETND